MNQILVIEEEPDMDASYERLLHRAGYRANAAHTMREEKVGSLPVLEHGRVIGIVTETDVLRQICQVDDICSCETADIVVSYP